MPDKEAHKEIDLAVQPEQEALSHGFSKQERLCGKTSISALLTAGRWGSTDHIRYCWLASEEQSANRILISVSKKYFKRAVKRNLLKRRIREAYRLNKQLLKRKGLSFMVNYTTREILDFATIEGEMRQVLSKINKFASK